MARKLEVEIVGDASFLNRALGSAGKSGQTFGQKIQHGARIAGLALGGVLAAGAVVGFKEMEQMVKVSAQTEAVLKSTGKAANVTAKHVDELASSISDYSGMDDEAVQAGENMLLTFTQIRNEVGKGNDIFDQATKVTADFAQALGKDMPEAAMTVGKALNNPIKGLGRLEKVGVSFTDKQKNLIKSLVESGDTMGAQKIILAELNKEFGGSAKAFGDTLPGQIAKAKEAFANMTGEMMLALLPAILLITQGLQHLSAFLREHPTLAKAMAVGLIALSAALMLVSVASTIAAASLTALWIASGIGVAVALAAALTILYMKSEKFRAAVDFLKDHWRVLLLALGLLPAIAAQIVKHWDSIKSVGVAAFDAVKAAIQRVIDVAKIVVDWIGKVIGKINDITAGPIDAITGAFWGVVGAIQSAWNWVKRLIDKINSIPIIPHFGGGSGGEVQGGGRGSQAPGNTGNPGSGRAIRGGSSAGVSVTFNGPVYGDPRSIAQAVREEFVKMQRNGSKLGFT